MPSNDTSVFCTEAASLLDTIWRPGYRYAKAGIMLSNLQGAERHQTDLFSKPQAQDRQDLMKVIDTINNKKRGTVFVGAQGIQRGWGMKREHLSPSYTTKWSDIPRV
jgi:DNA polymerase V